MPEERKEEAVSLCPMYWGTCGSCARAAGHQPPCVFRHGTGALFVSARVYRDALSLISSLDPHGPSGRKARELLEEVDRL